MFREWFTEQVLVCGSVFVIFCSADGKYEVTYKSNCVIYNNGYVNWIPPAIYKSSCQVDVQYFPFDEQECHMKFGSWTFNGDQLRFGWPHGVEHVDLNDYLKSGTWDIIRCPGVINSDIDEDDEVKIVVVFKFYLRRKTLFYTINLIIPCVLISFISMCVFALPADAGEKITLCISILVALVVFMLLVSKILPPSLKIPLISKYLLFTFIMNVFAIVITVIVINRNYRTPRTHRLPFWVRKVFLNYLPRMLFIKRPEHEERWKKKVSSFDSVDGSGVQSGQQNRQVQCASVNRRPDFVELTELHHPNCRLSPRTAPPDYDAAISESPDHSFPHTPELHKAVEAVRFITAHLRYENEYEGVLDDWKYVALVLDRLLLYIFLIVTVGGTCGIFMSAPGIFDYMDQDKIIEDLMGTQVAT